MVSAALGDSGLKLKKKKNGLAKLKSRKEKALEAAWS